MDFLSDYIKRRSLETAVNHAISRTYSKMEHKLSSQGTIAADDEERKKERNKVLTEYASSLLRSRSVNDVVQLNNKHFGETVPGAANFISAALLGYCSGWAVRSLSKKVALVCGAGYIGLQTLSYCGFVEIKWDKINDAFESQLISSRITFCGSENELEDEKMIKNENGTSLVKSSCGVNFDRLLFLNGINSKGKFSTRSDSMESALARQSLVRILTHGIPSASGFMVGFSCGMKGRFLG